MLAQRTHFHTCSARCSLSTEPDGLTVAERLSHAGPETDSDWCQKTAVSTLHLRQVTNLTRVSLVNAARHDTEELEFRICFACSQDDPHHV